MRSASTVGRLELYVAAAVVAAHASNFENGFRQRDLRFFTELFLNWGEELGFSLPDIQNTQLVRYISELVTNGFAKRVRKQGAPLYRLTRVGLIELVTRMTDPKLHTSPNAFLFLICFVLSYRDRIEDLVKREGAQFPPSLRIELQALLNPGDLLEAELRRIEKAIARLARRVDDAEKTSALVTQRLANGVSFHDVVVEAERKFPYELNSRKPLRELIAGIAGDQREWELRVGNTVRANNLWKPQKALMEGYYQQLRALKATMK